MLMSGPSGPRSAPHAAVRSGPLDTPHTVFLIANQFPCAGTNNMSTSSKMPISGTVVAQHNSRKSCWIIVHGACLYSTRSYTTLKTILRQSVRRYRVPRRYVLLCLPACSSLHTRRSFASLQSILVRLRCSRTNNCPTSLMLPYRRQQDHSEIRRKGCYV